MDSIIKTKFGERIKYFRKVNGYTQEQLAEHIGINLRQMARIEAGESFVTADTIYKFCILFKISPKILFDFELNENIEKNKNFELITKKIFDISSDPKKLEFITIAINALTDKSSLEKLKLIIKGMELTL